MYTTKVGCSITKTYLDEIKKLGKLSGRGFEEVLKDMMSEISKTIETDGGDDKDYGAKQLNTSLDTSEILHPQLLPGFSWVRFVHGGVESCPPAETESAQCGE